MSRSLFLSYALAIIFSCASVESLAQAASSSDTSQDGVVLSRSKLTSDEAAAAVRSKGTRHGTSLQTIRDLDSSATKREAAQHSLHESTSHHINLYSDGLFLDLLMSGGFLILEVDDTTGNAISLHLVSSRANGRAVIESRPVEGKVSASLAKELMKETADFVDVLLATPLNVDTLESKFYGGHFPESDETEDESFFTIPRAIRTIRDNENVARDLAAQFGAFQIWPIRRAISMPVFPSDPTRALGTAGQEREALTKEFMQRNTENPDFTHDIQNLESVRTSEQLRAREGTFRGLNEFLEQKLRPLEDSPTFAVNRSISCIVLQLGVPKPPEETSYAVMTASGIIVGWKLLNTGGMAVTKVSLAGD